MIHSYLYVYQKSSKTSFWKFSVGLRRVLTGCTRVGFEIRLSSSRKPDMYAVTTCKVHMQ